MKLDVSIYLKVLDLSKKTMIEFLQECNNFAFEIEKIIEQPCYET